MSGTLIENVPELDGRELADTHPQDLDLRDQDLDLRDRSITENTRFAYPLECNPHVAPGHQGPHPTTIVLLTADAFGVLPPVAILDPDEVMYHFVMGFTAKLAGTEVDVTEPAATFSPCFGAPFMARKPDVYARRDVAAGRAGRRAVLELGCSHVDLGAQVQPGGPAVAVEVELHPLALAQHPEDGALQGVVCEVDIGQVGLVDQHPVTGHGVVALDDALHSR